MLPGCDYGGRGAFQYNGVVCQWEQFCIFFWTFQKFVKNIRFIEVRIILPVLHVRNQDVSRRLDLTYPSPVPSSLPVRVGT